MERIPASCLSKRGKMMSINGLASPTYINVGVYLVFSPSAYTGEALLDYKTLECYQRFTAGWVREIMVLDEGEMRILTVKVLTEMLYLSGTCLCNVESVNLQVNHSQRMREKPLLSWFIAESSDRGLSLQLYGWAWRDLQPCCFTSVGC